MITCKIRYACRLCSKRKFYVMPAKEKVRNGEDYITSPDTFLVKCKNCGEEFILNITLREKE